MKKSVSVYEWNGKIIHPYSIITDRAKHPVRMIEGGQYLTEDMDTQFNEAGEMGIWGLNKVDYNYFKTHQIIKEIEIK